MKKSTLFLFGIALFISSCQAPCGDIFILYDNDVHCSIEGYEKMAALRADYLKQSIYVNVVSCGDFAQGNKVGSISKGKYPVAVMNSVPYDYVTLGNHEFDYGIPQLKKLMWWLHAKCLCCNLTYLPTGKNPFPAYDIRTYGTTKVAFIGVATPATISTSVPTNFQNEKGELEFDFHQDDIADMVQQAVNTARLEGAGHVIVLSHLGDDTKEYSSVDLIRQTTGINAVLDGHSHHVINTKIVNENGDSVILASTGSNFRYVGRLMITEGDQLYNELIDLNKYEGTNERLHSRIESIMKKVTEKTSKYVGFSEVTLTDIDEQGNRLVRMQETNLGDFAADAMRCVSGADIGVSNGGGLRSSLPAGKITYGDLLQVFPFNNTLYKVQATGQQIIDALEIAVSDLNPESGDFMQVSGLRYTVDLLVSLDSLQQPHRIVSAEIQRDTMWYPIHADSLYTVGGQNYLLVCGGSSGMFNGTKSLPIEHIPDIEVLSQYIQFMGDTIRNAQYAKPQQRIIFINK